MASPLNTYGTVLTHRSCSCTLLTSAVTPLQDIVEGKDSFTVTADAPGFSPDDIAVEMSEGTLTISGNRKEEQTEEKDGKVRLSVTGGH